jgi:hypothetical protein
MPYRDPEAHNRRYGAAHRAERARWRPVVAAGGCRCVHCGLRINPMEPWDLDHAPDGVSYNGPSHRGCNRSEGAQRSNMWRGGWGSGVPERRPRPGCPPEFDGGPNDVRRDADGVLHRKWGEW